MRNMPNILSTKSWFTKRRGTLLIVLAPIVFVLSGLFLTNQVLYSPESFQYQIGQLLSFIVSPFLLFLGIATCVLAKTRTSKTNLSTEPSNPNSSPQNQSPSPARSGKTDKPKSDMPSWERWTRRIFMISVLMTNIIAALIQPIVYMPVSSLFISVDHPMIMAFYLLKSRHGRVVTWLLVILALLSFLDLLPIPLSLLMGPQASNWELLYAGSIGLNIFGQVSTILSIARYCLSPAYF